VSDPQLSAVSLKEPEIRSRVWNPRVLEAEEEEEGVVVQTKLEPTLPQTSKFAFPDQGMSGTPA
jgi:hypothetical protein